MPRNEDGEFELILGNRQLLSVFFIIVILLGVFFTMGYIVGRNSAPLTEITSTTKQVAKPIVVEPAPNRQPEAPKPETPPAAAPTETAAQRPPETVETKKPTPLPKFEPEKKTESKKLPPISSTTADPVVGATYLQLAATARGEAEIMVDLLRKKHFPAIASEVPEKAGLFRVLVGPLAEGAANKTKSQLQDAGFPGNQAIRKTF
ncbi:MAG TPA: SPOR domain-containing protein [Bryobacteraceae bacterium]|nr:SPOR domain-containing protein [Bryobacteraceae bacterium]